MQDLQVQRLPESPSGLAGSLMSDKLYDVHYTRVSKMKASGKPWV